MSNRPQTGWKSHKSGLGDWVIIDENDELICRELRHWNKDLILSAVNGCKTINPNSPQAVADQIEAMYKTIRKVTILTQSMVFWDKADKDTKEIDTELHAVLNAIENKEK